MQYRLAVFKVAVPCVKQFGQVGLPRIVGPAWKQPHCWLRDWRVIHGYPDPRAARTIDPWKLWLRFSSRVSKQVDLASNRPHRLLRTRADKWRRNVQPNQIKVILAQCDTAVCLVIQVAKNDARKLELFEIYLLTLVCGGNEVRPR